jgi:hypothetical protein
MQMTGLNRPMPPNRMFPVRILGLYQGNHDRGSGTKVDTQYSFTADGRLIGETLYRSDGSKQTAILYDSKGRISELREYDKDGDLAAIIKYFDDDTTQRSRYYKGRPIEPPELPPIEPDDDNFNFRSNPVKMNHYSDIEERYRELAEIYDYLFNLQLHGD